MVQQEPLSNVKSRKSDGKLSHHCLQWEREYFVQSNSCLKLCASTHFIWNINIYFYGIYLAVSVKWTVRWGFLTKWDLKDQSNAKYAAGFKNLILSLACPIVEQWIGSANQALLESTIRQNMEGKKKDSELNEGTPLFWWASRLSARALSQEGCIV